MGLEDLLDPADVRWASEAAPRVAALELASSLNSGTLPRLLAVRDGNVGVAHAARSTAHGRAHLRVVFDDDTVVRACPTMRGGATLLSRHTARVRAGGGVMRLADVVVVGVPSLTVVLRFLASDSYAVDVACLHVAASAGR